MAQQGGEPYKKATKVYSIWGKAVDGVANPFHGVPLTNNGERRIKHTIKYDIGGGYRLITIQNDKFCMFCFAGNHDSCEAWLERNKGFTIVRDKNNQFDSVNVSKNINNEKERVSRGSDYAVSRLYERLEKDDLNTFMSLLPPLVMADWLQLGTMSTDSQIYDISSKIDDVDKSRLVYDVLMSLRAGDRNQALARMNLYLGLSMPVENIPEEELLCISDGMNIKKLHIGSDEYKEWFRQFINSSGYQDWMLFMHPTQQKIVDSNFDGSAKLSGVSGSGKTCIVVNRAIRLAKDLSEKKVLVLTLNKSLAALIRELLDYACPDEFIRQRIISKSFFELCQDYLNKFEPENHRLHDDVTWRHNEHIDEIWREFYRCELNNNDASVMFPIHKSLNSLGVDPEEYLRQEADWIRSAFCEDNRSLYYKAERKGRAIPMQHHQRDMVLNGLVGWERKMTDVGVIDYLGLSSKLCRHLHKLTPDYSAILVDEVQDFGTIELSIIRRLVNIGPNDIFLCGDMAQHVLPKHQSFRDACLDIPGARSLKITRNYRNSREILRAAYEIFISTMQGDVIMDGDMMLLDPEYANFSTPKPLVLKAESIEYEIAYALSYMNYLNQNDVNHKGCIAFAGYSLLEIKRFSDKLKIPVLDGTCGLLEGNLFMSDFEQTKGYEFDTMCVLNCARNILPPAEMPPEEQYRDSCRFYVAMTRAKKQLIISYSGEKSPWIDRPNCFPHFEFDEWCEVHIGEIQLYGAPKRIPQLISDPDVNPLELSGRRLLYTKHAIGMSSELQDKIDTLIDGIGMSRDGKRVKWQKIKDALNDVMRSPHAKQLFGAQKTWKEFVKLSKLL